MDDRLTKPSHEHVADEALDWFLRLQDPALAASQRRAFVAWRSADPARGAAFDQVAGLWQAPEFVAAIERHASPMPRRQRNPWIAAGVALAASILLLLGMAEVTGLLTPLRADYATRQGEQRSIVLADGSTLLLNSGSAVDVSFDAAGRKVQLLRGEAYFDVIPDPARPFAVESDHATVRVVGTAFAVRRDSDQDRVTVARGEVAVSGSEGAIVHLTPGQAVDVTASGPQVLELVSPDRDLAWREGRFRFEQRPLGEVIEELDRYDPGLILVATPALAAVRVSGDYRLTDTAAIAASLAAAVGAEILRLSDRIVIIQ